LDILILNTEYKLPYDIEIIGKECNTPNAFYSHQAKQIVMCYEFLDTVFADFEKYYFDNGIVIPDEKNFAAADTITWVFYHEVGHALYSIYGLPYTGLRENVADQFASYIILVETEFDTEEQANWVHDIMINVGTWFFINEQNQGHTYWDTHNLSIQRYYNISCVAYGSNPQYNSWLITDGWLPQKRADGCEYEYQVLEDSWSRLLAPYRIG